MFFFLDTENVELNVEMRVSRRPRDVARWPVSASEAEKLVVVASASLKSYS